MRAATLGEFDERRSGLCFANRARHEMVDQTKLNQLQQEVQSLRIEVENLKAAMEKVIRICEQKHTCG